MRTQLPKVMITAAVTGNLTTLEQTPHLPVTPEEIAEACLGAAEEGAAIAHIHVREPGTGKPSMKLEYYQDVVARIRARNRRLIINLTTGPGGRFVPSEEDPKIAGPGTTLMRPEDRVSHVAALRPEICTLDLNTMNSGGQVVINTPGNVRRMAAVIAAAGVKPEIELFDSGDIALMQDLLKDGTLKGPQLTSFVMGVKYGFQPLPRRWSMRAGCCRRMRISPRSASGVPPSRWWRNRCSRAAMPAPASRMPSSSTAACWPRATLRWSRRRGASSRTSARRS